MVFGFGRGSKTPSPEAKREEANVLFARLASGQACASSDGDGASTTATVAADAKNASSEVNPSNMMPKPNQKRASRQREKLSTDRESSTIPISERNDALHEHQRDATTTWQYPSEQMFFNAIARKGWRPKEEDMTNVIKIHNAVNERCWGEVMKWEKLHARECDCPKLLKFRGRPREYSPKARLLNFLGFKLPFDRHDWVVDRCGVDVRYVIDFYNGKSNDPRAPIAMHLDARPALDSFGAFFDRAYLQGKWMMSGGWMNGR